MLVDWTKHLQTEKEKEEFEKSIYGSKRILERLRALMDERELALDINERSVKQFESPNWAEKQAFHNGFRSCLHIVKKLIDLDQQEIKTTNE